MIHFQPVEGDYVFVDLKLIPVSHLPAMIDPLHRFALRI